MELTIFLIFLAISIILIIISAFNSSPVLGVVGFTFMFLLGLVILNNSISVPVPVPENVEFYNTVPQTDLIIVPSSRPFYKQNIATDFSIHVYKPDFTVLSGYEVNCSFHLYDLNGEIAKYYFNNNSDEYKVTVPAIAISETGFYTHITTCDGSPPVTDNGAINGAFVVTSSGIIYDDLNEDETHIYGYLLAILGALGFVSLLFELPQNLKGTYQKVKEDLHK